MQFFRLQTLLMLQIGLCFLSSTTWGAVAYVGTATANRAIAPGATYTLTSHTVPAGSNRYLVVTISWWSSPNESITSVTFNGTAMSNLISRPDTYNNQTAIYGLVAPAETTANVVVTFSGTGSEIAIAALNFTGVDQGTPTGTGAGANGISTTPSVTVTSAAGEMVVDSMLFVNSTAPVAGAGQSARYNPTGNGSANNAASTEAGAASVIMSWTLSVSETWVIVGIPLKAAAAAAPFPFGIINNGYSY